MKRPAPAAGAIAKSLAAGLLVFSTILVYFFPAAATRFRRNALPLPFGFAYQLRQESGFSSGRIQAVVPERIRALWAGGRRGDLLILDSWIHSPKSQAVNLHFGGNGDRELIVNDAKVADSASVPPTLRLRKCLNRIRIKFVPDSEGIPQLSFQVSERVAFYDFVLPRSRASRGLSRLLSFLDRGKAIPFLLAFLFLLFPMIRSALAPARSPESSAGGDRGFVSSLFRAFSFFMVSAPLAVYLNHATGVGLPDPGLLIGCAAASLGLLIKDPFRGSAGFRIDRDLVIVFILIGLAVFAQIYASSGSFLPPPTEGSDFDNHLRMMEYYEKTGNIFPRLGFIIYPQGIHDVLVLAAGFFGLSLEKTLILFLVLVLIMLYGAVYLLGRDLFGRIPGVHYALAFSLSYFPFIYERLFRWYSFPSIVAILFFLLSLHFFLKGDRPVSSVALAGALITYPYYAVIFGLIFFFLFLDRFAASPEPTRRKLMRAAAFFALPLFSSAVYLHIYWSHGLSQQQEGFNALYKIDPFLSLHGVNALLFLAGMYFLGKAVDRPMAVRASLGLILGFLIYDVPYRFLSLISTYYFLKTMQVLILMGILVETFALSRIFRNWEHKTSLRYLLWAGAAGIFAARILGLLDL